MVEKMLDMAHVTARDFVIDLGSSLFLITTRIQ